MLCVRCIHSCLSSFPFLILFCLLRLHLHASVVPLCFRYFVVSPVQSTVSVVVHIVRDKIVSVQDTLRDDYDETNDSEDYDSIFLPFDFLDFGV